jgi:phosphoenolpyruvate carboxylase
MPDTTALPVSNISVAELKDTPLYPAGRARFKQLRRCDVHALYKDLVENYERFLEQEGEIPSLSPISRLALFISRRISWGDLTYGDIEQLIQYLSADGFIGRAAALARYQGELDPAANLARLRARFTSIALPAGADEPVSFETFRAKVEGEVFGIVFTAHPTFNITYDLMRAQSALMTGKNAEGKPLSEAEREDLLHQILTSEHRPDEDLSLQKEHDGSMVAIGNIQKALRHVYRLVIEVAREFYGDKADSLMPRMVTVASWVGYDLDGRSDIRWSDMLHKRLRIQAAQLRFYLDEVREIRTLGRGNEDLRHTMDLIESRLALAINEVTEEVNVFSSADPASPAGFEAIRKLARRMHDARDLRLNDARSLVDKVNMAMRQALTLDSATAAEVNLRLSVMRAELANYGLGMAHTHVRINSTQIHNAIRKRVGMETSPEDPRFRQTFQRAITELLDKVEPASINFGSVMSEHTSAKRLMMVVAQMLKYSDSDTPIRFLIAETESAFTLLTALYYARLFGIADRVDISPLFETELALRDGSKLIDELLSNPHYRAYVEQRGRLCVQTGYSDAGRYLGQTVACTSIERLRRRLVRTLIKHGLGHVQLLMFDTHGESIGRGRHPASFEDRLSYVATPDVLAEIEAVGLPYKEEMSFQGGDGYQYFINEDGALAVLTRILDYILEPKQQTPDPFYERSSFIREFFTTVKEFQVDLMQDPNYGALLSAFGTNLLYPSGSRAMKRQHDSASDKVDYAHPSQLRAIPHNATLMQLGLLANSIGGVGEAIERDPEHFVEMYTNSPRFRQVMGIAEYGLAISDCNALEAYVETLNPDFWISRSGYARDIQRAADMRRLAGHLEQSGLYEKQLAIYRRLHNDYTLLKEGLTRVGGGKIGGCYQLISEASRVQLAVQHALRIALIHELYMLATHIPEFSSQHGTTPQRLISRILHLDIEAVAAQLARIFPAQVDSTASMDFGEKASYVSDDTQSYNQENDKIFQPMRGLFDLIRRLTTANVHIAGFLG